MRAAFAAAAGLAFAGRGLYRLVARGQLTLDTGIGRRVARSILRSAPRARSCSTSSRLPILGERRERWRTSWPFGNAARTWCSPLTSRRSSAVPPPPVETVRFERPERIDFRVVRGPVPHVVESFLLYEEQAGTRLRWEGELGTDFWAAGEWWGELVARQWQRAVRRSLAAIIAEAERLAAREAGSP